MADDELLEDGDFGETNYEMDLADEDALLADDGDEVFKGSDNIEDDDYLELGLDDDLNLQEDEVLENGSKRERIEINDNDESEEKRGERSRFKSERQLTLTTSTVRDTSTIPETLDAVRLRNPPAKTQGGRGGGRGGGGTRGGGGGARGGGPHQQIGHHQQGPQRRFQRNHNIHVNPHFRPRFQFGGGGGMWNGFPGQQAQPPFHQQPPFHSSFQPTPFQPGQEHGWNDQGCYPLQGPPQYPNSSYYSGSTDGYYGGGGAPPAGGGGGYHHQLGPPPPGQPVMGWGDDFYQGPPPPQPNIFPAPQFGLPHPHQMGPPRMRPGFSPPASKPFIRPNNQQGLRPQKRDQQSSQKQPPAKVGKFEQTGQRLRSNLEEVKVVDALPSSGGGKPTTTPSSTTKPPSQPSQPPPLASPRHNQPVPVPIEEEDEEMKAYREKIEEQKKLREKILREKEEKRYLAAQQKKQESVQVLPVEKCDEIKPAPDVSKSDYKLVKVRQANGSTVLKRLSVEEIKKLKKVPTVPKTVLAISSSLDHVKIKNIPPGAPSRVVSIANLSASTTQAQLQEMAAKFGPLEKVDLDVTAKTAIIIFKTVDSAKNFVFKYQKKMIDLSMVNIRFVN